MRSRKPRRGRELAAERVLAELDGTATEATARPPANAEEAAEVEAMRAMTNLLAKVPADAWTTVPALALRDEPAAQTALPQRRLRLTRPLAAAAAAACIAVGFGAGALVEGGHSGGSTPPARQADVPSVVLRPLAPGAGHSLAVAYMPGSDQMLLRVAHLPPSAPGTYYELWLMTSLRRLTPVTAFQIGAAGRAQLTLRLPDSSSRYLYLDISLQRVGGGTGHSGDSVLRGRLT